MGYVLERSKILAKQHRFCGVERRFEERRRCIKFLEADASRMGQAMIRCRKVILVDEYLEMT
jgi:hypothetical protein